MPQRLRTYSHLAAARRQPTEYEIGTTRLHHAGRLLACAYDGRRSLWRAPNTTGAAGLPGLRRRLLHTELLW